jgi:hypothetical protein
MTQTRTIIKVNAFMYDLYNKCNRGEKFTLSDLQHHHKLSSAIIDAVNKSGLIKSENKKSHKWISNSPTDKHLQLLLKLRMEKQDEYNVTNRQKKNTITSLTAYTKQTHIKTSPKIKKNSNRTVKSFFQKLFSF